MTPSWTDQYLSWPSQPDRSLPLKSWIVSRLPFRGGTTAGSSFSPAWTAAARTKPKSVKKPARLRNTSDIGWFSGVFASWGPHPNNEPAALYAPIHTADITGDPKPNFLPVERTRRQFSRSVHRGASWLAVADRM